jgi:hypothetical protein
VILELQALADPLETKAHQVQQVHPGPKVQLDPQVQWVLNQNNGDDEDKDTSNKVSSNKDIRTSTESH